MNQMGGWGFYIAIFPTVLPTKHLLLSVALNSVSNELIFEPIVFENPARLFDLSANPSVNVPTIILLVNVPTDHTSDMHALRDVRKPSVIVAQFRNFLSTLCEIPTGASLSVLSSVIVAQFCKLFSTLCEILMGTILLVKPSILHVFLSILLHKILNCKLKAHIAQ